jgi:hypothetical protein
MQSFIGFVLWFNLNSLSVLIILDEYRGIVDKCALNRATDLLPGVLFVIELESYDKNDHFVNVHGDVPLFCQSLQKVRTARGINLQSHCPDAN